MKMIIVTPTSETNIQAIEDLVERMKYRCMSGFVIDWNILQADRSDILYFGTKKSNDNK